MNPVIVKVAVLGLLGAALIPAQIKLARTFTQRAHAIASDGEVAAVRRAAHILVSTAAGEARAMARGAAYDVALRAVRGASALYAATVNGLPGAAPPGVRVTRTRKPSCPQAHAKSCAAARVLVRVRTVETS